MNKPQRETLSTSSFGLIFWSGLRRITKAAGYSFRPVWLGRLGGNIGVWGRVRRSERLIDRYQSRAPIITFEDAFLRSVKPGPKAPPLGITVDKLGVHFDGSKPSDLENSLQNAPLDNTEELARARDGIDFLRHYGLSKYNLCPRGTGNDLEPGYVLVVDQLAGDASIRYGDASAETFTEMLRSAREEHPNKRIIIRAHPAANGESRGHFLDSDTDTQTIVLDGDYNPWDLIENAAEVYCVTSLMGFEAILAGKKPKVFGKPFYSSWGLSDDRQPISRRTRTLSVEQLFQATMLDYPVWFDRAGNTICTFETAASQLLAEARHYWDGRKPTIAVGMRLWKHRYVARYLSGAGHQPRFDAVMPTEASDDTAIVVWANKVPAETKGVTRMEDGFLRSAGLGATLTPPGSLVLDDIGIYYDPNHPSRLEELIKASPSLPEVAIKRAAALRRTIIETGVNKYNLSGDTRLPEIPEDRFVILVPGQVENDASIQTGTTDIKTNAALLQAARTANPDAYIIYKPHPDAEAGLRDGGSVNTSDYDWLAKSVDPNALITRCDAVWTMTSLIGFEALLRGKNVTCLGMPFYAGWGLTVDNGPSCDRRTSGISLDGLIHATLIDYPRYMDPVSGLPCSVELAVSRLDAGQGYRRPALRVLSKLQSWLSQYATIWR